MSGVQHLRGHTFHGRKGAISNAFRYAVDYVLLDPLVDDGPALFSRNRGNLTSVHDRDHGGAPNAGRGVVWAHDVLAAHGVPKCDIQLLTQARVLGHVFNPVSFWLCFDSGKNHLRAVIAEVSNTFGQRHSYLCHRADMGVITRDDTISAVKIFHVSPFQPVAGGYTFRFDITAQRIGIWIDYSNGAGGMGGGGIGGGGLIATLTGQLRPLTNAGILAACLRRPFGSRRVLALIFWQAFKLRLKGAIYRAPPAPPEKEVS